MEGNPASDDIASFGEVIGHSTITTVSAMQVLMLRSVYGNRVWSCDNAAGKQRTFYSFFPNIDFSQQRKPKTERKGSCNKTYIQLLQTVTHCDITISTKRRGLGVLERFSRALRTSQWIFAQIRIEMKTE